jgi:uncharacterized membrane protein
MIGRLRHTARSVGGSFWLVPGFFVAVAFVAAVVFVEIDRSGAVPAGLLRGPWLYNGGSTGARTLLGAVASSTIGVAGTVFSITIAALSLAAGQMGPRLLRNFTRDRGVQIALGTFLGTFTFALMVLRAVRDKSEGAFVPHLALSASIFFALVSVAMLIYFVDHMANRINVDTVIELVSADMRAAFERLTSREPGPPCPSVSLWDGAVPVRDMRRGYLERLNAEMLADWAAGHATSLCLAIRLGDYVFPGAPVGLAKPDVRGVAAAIVEHSTVDPERASTNDLEFAVRQLVEVAVRALSPGINDPATAISVLDRLAVALCDLVPRYLPSGVHVRDERVVLVVPQVDYDGLVDGMFHLIRQNAEGSTAVLAHAVDVLVAVARCEREPARLATLARHVELIRDDAIRSIPSESDRADVLARYATFVAVSRDGPVTRLIDRCIDANERIAAEGTS